MSNFVRHSFPAPNGEHVPLHGADGGRWVCPVCGALFAGVPPYDPHTGAPSFAWCPVCEVQFGWDDRIPPDDPPGSLARAWSALRERWLDGGVPVDEAERQLRNLPQP